MTREQLIERLEALEEDVSYYTLNGEINITIFDFEGFDENWNEIYRDLDHPEEVDALLEDLKSECSHTEGNCYTTYFFDGFQVCVGYSSYDI